MRVVREKKRRTDGCMELGRLSVDEEFILVNLWVTLECNYECKYCYEKGKKEFSYIDKAKAEQIIDFIHKQCINENKDNIWINFHGGEPMLNSNIIKYIIDSIREKNIVTKMYTSLTTNCSIYDETIIGYICELTVSIDGTRTAHDRNRVTKSGAATYERSIKNALRYLHNHPNIRVRTVVTPNNVAEVYEGIKQLLDMGFRNIVPGVDYFDNTWEYKDFDTLYEQIKMIKKYINQYKICDAHIGILDDKIHELGVCYAGCDGYQIDTDGRLYPCSYVVRDSEFCIGDVENGFDENKIVEINSINKKKVGDCVGCENYKYCETPRCLLLNKQLTGDFYSPSPVVCAYENLLLRVHGLL